LGWCWVPGTVWAPSWVSWRQGQTESCSCLGWAPLPPEASCEANVGVSTWVDRTCDIGPDAYVFVNVRDFGTDSYTRCGCVYGRERNVTIIEETVNITNIVYTNNITYSGGPDYRHCNDLIRRFGGREVGTLTLDRVQSSSELNGRNSRLEGSTLALVSPLVPITRDPKRPSIATTIPHPTIDKGWGRIKDPGVAAKLKSKIADETKGATPKTSFARLPAGVPIPTTKTDPTKTTGQNSGVALTQQPGQTLKGAGPVAQTQGHSGATMTNSKGPLTTHGQHPGDKLTSSGLTGAGKVGEIPGATKQHPGQKTTVGTTPGALSVKGGQHPGERVGGGARTAPAKVTGDANTVKGPHAVDHPPGALTPKVTNSTSGTPTKGNPTHGVTVKQPTDSNEAHPKDLMGATKDSGSSGPVESAHLPGGKKGGTQTATHTPSVSAEKKVSVAPVHHDSAHPAHKTASAAAAHSNAEPTSHKHAATAHAEVHRAPSAPRASPPRPKPQAATVKAQPAVKKNAAKPTPTPHR
ncbi:MAG: DUF6600 domain-containing protein, partial [Chthoniobacterales bacterium]